MERESESALRLFKQSEMLVNTDKFRAIILNKKESDAKYKPTTDNNDIESNKPVKLLGITTDDHLRFG